MRLPPSAVIRIDCRRMAEVGNTLVCAAVMAALWTLIGAPIAARLAPRGAHWLFAPALGWSVYSAVALPLFSAIGWSRIGVLATAGVLAAAALAALWRWRSLAKGEPASPVLILAVVGAGALALAPMAAILPKVSAAGVALAEPIFDHSKIALVTEIMRSGVPAANPFFSELGAPERVSYYYLWHFSAAMMGLASGVSGWEADAALTWFTAFASLLTVIGLAVQISGRAWAALFAVAIAVTGSARAVVEHLFGVDAAYSVVGGVTGFGPWLSQVAWAPQHVASATSAVLACCVLMQMPGRRGATPVIVLALLAAASIESSVWVGLTFAVASVAIGVMRLWTLPAAERGPFLLGAAVAAALAIALAAPYVFDQITTIGARDGGPPITVGPLPVLGDAFPETLRRLLDLPAFWLVYLPLELPASYPAGIVMLCLVVAAAWSRRRTDETALGLAVLAVTSLLVTWLLVSNLGGNNDLSWRGALPAILLLIAFAAAGMARWTVTRARASVALALVAVVFGLPNGIAFIIGSWSAPPGASAAVFAKTPAMWEAVRRHTSPHERVANNPQFLADVTAWPVNISWALLADRRACYTGNNLAIPFAPVSAARRNSIEAQFDRVFAGNPNADDIREMATRLRCDVVVIVPQDGAWSRDPFASSGIFVLAEERPDAWRIYRKATALPQGR